MFLHGGLIHIGGNMLYLWIFGNNIEDVLGHIKFIFFYFTGGAIAAGAHILSNPASQVPTIGASGAIAAVLGAYMVLYPTRRVICLVLLGFFFTTIAVPAVVVLGLWVFLQFINAAVTGGGMTPGVGGVAYWAHIGGFAAGVVGILLLGGQRLVRQRWYDRPLRRNWYEE
jgi:membrane associated rhomboid family serine protease